MKHILLTFSLFLSSAVLAQSLPSVSDTDANGRNMIHLGAANTGFIYMKSDCSEELAAGLKCTIIQPAPAPTEFQHEDIVSIRIPARAANSMLCFDITPLIDVTFENTTGNPVANALFSGRATLTLKSPVLEDPSLVRPGNGEPYNGELRIPTVQYSEQLKLDAGERNARSYHYTRSCGSASLSKQKLISIFGFDASQANSFFNNAITVELDASAIARHISYVHYDYHVRLYGDRR